MSKIDFMEDVLGYLIDGGTGQTGSSLGTTLDEYIKPDCPLTINKLYGVVEPLFQDFEPLIITSFKTLIESYYIQYYTYLIYGLIFIFLLFYFLFTGFNLGLLICGIAIYSLLSIYRNYSLSNLEKNFLLDLKIFARKINMNKDLENKITEIMEDLRKQNCNI